MKTTDIIRRAGRSLRQAKIRTILTSLAIGVGAFTLTLSLAAGAGGVPRPVLRLQSVLHDSGPAQELLQLVREQAERKGD